MEAFSIFFLAHTDSVNCIYKSIGGILYFLVLHPHFSFMEYGVGGSKNSAGLVTTFLCLITTVFSTLEFLCSKS